MIETGAGRVFVRRMGPDAAPPLVLVHGFPMSSWCFADAMPLLARTHHVIAIDLPGFGDSDCPSPQTYGYDLQSFAATVAEVLDALDVREAALLGHSMGGGIALELATTRPDLVERLVLCCSAVYHLPLPWEARVALWPGVGHFVWTRLFTRGDMARALRRGQVKDPAALSDEFVTHYWEQLNREGAREAAFAALHTLHRLGTTSPAPAQVSVPTLLLWGEDDRTVPVEHAHRLREEMRSVPGGAQLRVMRECGHTPFVERPEEFLHHVRWFLGERDGEDQDLDRGRFSCDAAAPGARGEEAR